MKCIDPVLCYERKFRHFSLASPMFKALHTLVFDCRTCIICRKKRASELAMRCVLHSSLSDQNCFLTLTYDEKREGYHNVFHYPDIQGFKKRLRSYCSYHFDKKVQLFNVHEYGKNGKKHWHLVCFNHDFADKVYMFTRNGNRLYRSDKLDSLWGFGHCSIGEVTEASAMYTAQYAQKDFKYDHAGTSKGSHSKHSGIGRDFFYAHSQQILRLGYVPFEGRKAPVPRYFYRLAHRHYCHFYEPVAFVDTKERKALYRPFAPGAASRAIAEDFIIFRSLREEYIREISDAWFEEVSAKLFSTEPTDFQKSGSNYLYDLNNRTFTSEF